MFLAGIIAAAAVVLFVLGLLAPRLSKKEQRKIDDALSSAASDAREAPGRIGKWLSKPFVESRKGADKSSAAGRKTRSKLRQRS